MDKLHKQLNVVNTLLQMNKSKRNPTLKDELIAMFNSIRDATYKERFIEKVDSDLLLLEDLYPFDLSFFGSDMLLCADLIRSYTEFGKWLQSEGEE